MCKRKIIRKYNWVEVDKTLTLQEQVNKLLPVTELQFIDYLEKYGEVLEMRKIGYIERYYNDYGVLLALQDGIQNFYLKGGVNDLH